VKISEIGGEFGLIRRVARRETLPGVKVSLGDDCAVLGHTASEDLLVTVDMMVEGTHFRTDWSSPHDIGWKAMESNVSDIASMGGVPRFAFVSLCLRKDATVEFVDELYRGLNDSCARTGVHILGGDTTSGELCAINVALLGTVEKDGARLRSWAKRGDIVGVTGDLGKSEAGLLALMKEAEFDSSAHLAPVSRPEWGRKLRPLVNSMMDVSDGLAGDVAHICEESKVGVEIEGERVPISSQTRGLATRLGADPLEWALHGGEDYELLFTCDRADMVKISSLGFPVSFIGKVVDQGKGMTLSRGGVKAPLGRGYDHFA